MRSWRSGTVLAAMLGSSGSDDIRAVCIVLSPKMLRFVALLGDSVPLLLDEVVEDVFGVVVVEACDAEGDCECKGGCRANAAMRS